jgi:maltooligosyltrehalose trehalohydrolase
LDAQWNDDFHHSLHTALVRDERGYFADYHGIPSLANAFRDGYVYEGQFSAYRGRRHGASSVDRPGEQFVVFTQNHDQVANAFSGSRASLLLSAEQQRLAAAVLICCPFLPLLFMGQEYSETAGFYYFTDYGDPVLAEAVRQGRKQEAGAFLADGEFLDPQGAATFLRSKLNWRLLEESLHAGMLAWYRDLLEVRKQNPCLSNCRKDLTKTESDLQGWLVLKRDDPSGSAALLVCNFSDSLKSIPVAAPAGHWRRRLWSGATLYGGSGAEPAACLSGDSDAVEIEGHGAALYLLE